MDSTNQVKEPFCLACTTEVKDRCKTFRDIITHAASELGLSQAEFVFELELAKFNTFAIEDDAEESDEV